MQLVTTRRASRAVFCSQFHEWAKQYGEIFYLRLGPQNVVVLNSAAAADELLSNRSKDYSGRATPHVAQDLMSEGQRMVLMPHDRAQKVRWLVVDVRSRHLGGC